MCHDDSTCHEAKLKAAQRLLRTDVETPVIFLGMGTCGLGAGAAKVHDALVAYCEKHQLPAQLIQVGCIGLCTAEPLVDVQLPGRNRISFGNVSPDTVDALLSELLAGTTPSQPALGQYRQEHTRAWENVPYLDEHPFFGPQTRWVLANCGVVDPARIDEYIARGGYRAFATTLATKTPAECCDIVERSGLRGRGGGGFPTGKKWKVAYEQAADQKYLVCNADEGDPGAFMDRAVVEGDPHRVLEGMAIAAYAIGATKAIVYIRAEYPLAIQRLRAAIEQARTLGLLGYNILDSGVSLDISIKQGAGAFVCGEETALLHSIEGKRGMPRLRPPFPAESGLHDKPTVINNVETFANVAAILENGDKWFSSVGTEHSEGTKVFAVSGRVNRTGLVEIAMGTPIRTLVFDVCGGVPNARTFKAVQIGGPSGGCIPTCNLDIAIDYESLKSVGAIMGSGGLVVMDETTCMVDIAKYFMSFIQRESCGKCIPCREGTKRLLEILTRITSGRRHEQEHSALERFKGVLALEELSEVIRDTSLCGLGQTAPNPVLSTLRWFKDEYEAHIFERRCPAGACADLLTYKIDQEKCRGCTACARACPSDAILGTAKAAHYIVPERCIGCGNCISTCRFDAITVA